MSAGPPVLPGCGPSRRSGRAFVSTAIPYVNARPHVGFAMELIQGDVIARYLRARGVETFFLTGTDENSLKNVRAARELGVSTVELCERNSAEFRALIPGLNISADGFLRTSHDPRHAPAARRLWSSSRPGDIYQRHYEGLYCVGCEDFPPVDDSPNPICPEHGTPLETVKEENHFFRLSAYQEQIVGLLESGTLRVIPESRRNEMLAFAKSGLRDFSVSRTVERAGGWGIGVPGDPGQVMYVWFDALTNYLSGLDYATDGDLYERFWVDCGERIHVIGKGINRFHTIYWPAMLLSAGLPLPHTVVVHGYLTVEGRKISKSLGNVIDPLDQVAKFGVDPFRFYLLRTMSPFEDGDYAEARLRGVFNSDLANNVGNLLCRVEACGERAAYTPREDLSIEAPEGFHAAMSDFRFHDALAILWSEFTNLNQMFEVHRPWDLIRQGRAGETTAFLDAVVGRLHAAARWLEPFMPETSLRIRQRLRPGGLLRREAPMFPRLEGGPGAADPTHRRP
jgi:methionyl-tRNA synthetase